MKHVLTQRLVRFGMAAIVLLATPTPAPATPPDILYVLTDDQRYDSIAAFNRIVRNSDDSVLGPVESPNVDALVARGTTFINTYVQAPACAPSRASVHTGRYPWRSGVYEFEWHNREAEHWRPTLPEVLAGHGYQTFHVGKLGFRHRTLQNGRPRPAPVYEQDVNFHRMWREGFTDWFKGEVTEVDGRPLPAGTDPVHTDWIYTPGSGASFTATGAGLNDLPGFEDQSRTVDERYDFLRMHRADQEPVPGRGEIIGGVSPKPAGETRDGQYVRVLRAFLDHPGEDLTIGTQPYRGVDPDRPLFAHLGFDFPHTPVLPPADWRARFADITYDLPTPDPDEVDDLPPPLQKLVTQWASDHFTEDQKQQMTRDYFAFCAYGDALVGEAVEAFVAAAEARGRPWRVVYVCGDHGWKLNEHGALSKFSPWGIDRQNPVVVVASEDGQDAFPPGKVVTAFAEFVDLMPTMLAMAGVDVDAPELGFLDGRDLARVASGDLPPRDYVLGESHAVVGPRATLRSHDYLLSLRTRPNRKHGERMAWARDADFAELEPVLYDLRLDPDETRNVAFDPAYADVAATLRAKLLDIVLGDGRVEVDWPTEGPVFRGEDFAPRGGRQAAEVADGPTAAGPRQPVNSVHAHPRGIAGNRRRRAAARTAARPGRSPRRAARGVDVRARRGVRGRPRAAALRRPARPQGRHARRARRRRPGGGRGGHATGRPGGRRRHRRRAQHLAAGLRHWRRTGGRAAGLAAVPLLDGVERRVGAGRRGSADRDDLGGQRPADLRGGRHP